MGYCWLYDSDLVNKSFLLIIGFFFCKLFLIKGYICCMIIYDLENLNNVNDVCILKLENELELK